MEEGDSREGQLVQESKNVKKMVGSGRLGLTFKRGLPAQVRIIIIMSIGRLKRPAGLVFKFCCLNV